MDVYGSLGKLKTTFSYYIHKFLSFKRAHKVSESFKNIPKVTTSHNYAINKKFVYKCLDCGQE
jgi:hypothetical protein